VVTDGSGLVEHTIAGWRVIFAIHRGTERADCASSTPGSGPEAAKHRSRAG